MHLYAGPDEGYTLRRALKESGGDPTRLYELDIVQGRADDMMAYDAKYAALLRMAMDGWIDGVVGGPNCRTRSELLFAPRAGYPCRSAHYSWDFQTSATCCSRTSSRTMSC